MRIKLNLKLKIRKLRNGVSCDNLISFLFFTLIPIPT